MYCKFSDLTLIDCCEDKTCYLNSLLQVSWLRFIFEVFLASVFFCHLTNVYLGNMFLAIRNLNSMQHTFVLPAELGKTHTKKISGDGKSNMLMPFYSPKDQKIDASSISGQFNKWATGSSFKKHQLYSISISTSSFNCLPTLTLSYCYETPTAQIFSVNTKLNDVVFSSCSVLASWFHYNSSKHSPLCETPILKIF